MGNAENQPPMSSLHLDVTLPCEPRFLPMLRRLAERTVDYIGYHSESRDEVVGTLDTAIRSAFEGDAARYSAIAVRFATTDRDMLVRIRYLGVPSEGPVPISIEERLSRGDSGDTPIERLRRAMTTVTFGRGDDGDDFCELTKRLPDHHA